LLVAASHRLEYMLLVSKSLASCIRLLIFFVFCSFLGVDERH